jgi:hypothetical protein
LGEVMGSLLFIEDVFRKLDHPALVSAQQLDE